jgi:galactokinase
MADCGRNRIAALHRTADCGGWLIAFAIGALRWIEPLMRDRLATCARSAENSKFAGGHCGWLDQLLIVCSKVMTTDCL